MSTLEAPNPPRIHLLTRACTAVLLVTAAVLCFFVPVHPRERKEWGNGFTIDLDQPYPLVLDVVQSVTEDGIIRGTFEYKGTSQLEGASPAKSSDAFPAASGQGTVLYKVRSKTLAPEHFRDSGDQGTVTVRYIVQSLGPQSTRLRIDAIFRQDAGHRSHPSDGTPENAEFLVIADKLKDIADQQQKRLAERAAAQQAQQLAALQAELEQENIQLKAVLAQQDQVQKEIQQLQDASAAQIKTSSADLKAAPYVSSTTLQALPPGETVTILRRTPNWCRVQTKNGAQGWVNRRMLEATP